MKLGSPATGEDFRGRQLELNNFWRLIENDHMKLPGARRLGKTSLLQRLVEQAREHGVYAKWIDVSAIQSPADFLREIERQFPASGISAFVKKQSAKATGWLSRINKVGAQAPELLGGGGINIELTAAAVPGWMPNAQALQERLQDQPLLILVDEFPVMLQALLQQNPVEAGQLLKVLRTWRQTGHWRFVFTGSIGLASLLERHGLAIHMNDCFDFPLGPMRRNEALAMWKHFCQKTLWTSDDAIGDYAITRIGWISPYYLNLLLDETLRVVDIRAEETVVTLKVLTTADVDSAYENMLASRSRFHHWEKRLRDGLQEPDLGMCLALLDHVAKKNQEGLSLAQLSQRLSKREPDLDIRKRLLQSLLARLSDEGYLSPPDAAGRVHFMSFLLRDWWQRNH